MSKICGYNCEYNKSGVCQITRCNKKSVTTDNTKIIIELQREYKQLKENYERLYNENCKLRERHNINDISLLDENYRLENNWNRLKEHMTNAEQIYKESDDKYVKDMREMGIRHAYRIILYKMQELERGVSDDNH